LTAIVAEEFARRAPLADGALDHLHHRLGLLLPIQAVTHDVAAVVVDHPDQIDAVHPLQLKREDVDLPHRVGHGPLETTDLHGPATGLGRRLAEVSLVDHTTSAPPQ